MRDLAPRGKYEAKKTRARSLKKPSSKCAMFFTSSSVIIRRYLFEGEV